MRTLFASTLLALLAITPARARPVNYLLDSSHTQVRVIYDHLGFSHPSIVFTGLTGILVYDADHPERSKVTVDIPMSGMDAHVHALNEHLRRADFFDSARFPVARFVSTGVTPVDARHLQVTGRLSVHGVTRPVTLAVTLNGIGKQPILDVPAIGFDATASLRRSQFRLGGYAPIVGDTVQLHITVEADARQ